MGGITYFDYVSCDYFSQLELNGMARRVRHSYHVWYWYKVRGGYPPIEQDIVVLRLGVDLGVDMVVDLFMADPPPLPLQAIIGEDFIPSQAIESQFDPSRLASHDEIPPEVEEILHKLKQLLLSL